MNKQTFSILLIIVALTIFSTTVLASGGVKHIENIISKNGGCIECHAPNSKQNLKNEIIHMAEDGRHPRVPSLASNKGPQDCTICHVSNLGKVLHRAHLSGKDNSFLSKYIKTNKGGCVSCHDFNSKKGTLNKVTGLNKNY
ncbi:MAG: hypothetical protein AWU54_1068 [Candidatus Frackibacter sp. T328-2]|nr:MAG: hypothetical protein AWU54_1068 [Candidatus Frackibacter sp. T328-2]